MRPTVIGKVTLDRTKDLKRDLARLHADMVLVGIPEAEIERKDDGKGEAVNNAQLLFLHTNGSELRGLSARPVIEPALINPPTRKRLVALLGQAAEAEVSGDHQACLRILGLAGTAGANAAKRWFKDPANGWPGNKRSTILRKLRKVKGAAKKELDRAIAAGEDLSQFDTPLIDTDQMRGAITYVVQD